MKRADAIQQRLRIRLERNQVAANDPAETGGRLPRPRVPRQIDPAN
jgi:hypothetical protein